MTIFEMCNILDLNNIKYKKRNNIVQEEHGSNEDYYELRNLQNNGFIYYCIREKNTEDIEIFKSSIKDINKRFLLILLAKNELKYSRKIRNELIRKIQDVNKMLDLKKQIEKCNITTQFSIGEDKNLAVNVVIKENEYLLLLNKNRITVYSEIVKNFSQLKIKLPFLLLKNDYLRIVVEKGQYEGYTLELGKQDYEWYFSALRI